MWKCFLISVKIGLINRKFEGEFMFKDQIAEQLRKMSEEEKNQWIMNQAILCDENARDDFFKRLAI